MQDQEEDANTNQEETSSTGDNNESGSWEEPPSEALDPQEGAGYSQGVMTEQEKEYIAKNTRDTRGNFSCLICYEDIKHSFQPHCPCQRIVACSECYLRYNKNQCLHCRGYLFPPTLIEDGKPN